MPGVGEVPPPAPPPPPPVIGGFGNSPSSSASVAQIPQPTSAAVLLPSPVLILFFRAQLPSLFKTPTGTTSSDFKFPCFDSFLASVLAAFLLCGSNFALVGLADALLDLAALVFFAALFAIANCLLTSLGVTI